MLIINDIFHVTVLLLIYFYHQLVPALKKTLRQLANDLVLSQEDKPQTHRTASEISRETDIHRSSVSQRFLQCGHCAVCHAWPPVHCVCVPQLFEQLINITLCQVSQEIRLPTSSLCTLSNTNFVSKSCPRRLISC